jgi:hypothetical protein
MTNQPHNPPTPAGTQACRLTHPPAGEVAYAASLPGRRSDWNEVTMTTAGSKIDLRTNL